MQERFAQVWEIFEPLLPKHESKPHPLGCHRPRIDDRKAAEAIWFVMENGCKWKALDKTILCKHSTAHRRLQQWVQAGVFLRLFQKALEGFDCLVGIDWQWLCVDGVMNKAPLGGKKTGSSPVDRSKLGVKRSVVVEGHGVPLNMVIDGANRHDSKLLEQTLATLLIRQPAGGPKPNVCLDKGYDYGFVREALERLGFVGHVRPIGEESRVHSGDAQKKPRRWKIERTGSWFNRFRGILIRWAKKPANYLAFLYLAAAAITLQRAYASADCLLG